MKRILVTRPRAQADGFAEKLQSAGFEPIFFPVIEIQPIKDNPCLERALEKLNCYEWIVFTSVNGVDVVFSAADMHRHGENISSLRLRDSMASPRIAAIGPKTAEALRSHGITPDFVPEEYVAESILPGLGDLVGKWILLPRAEIARKALPEAILNAGGVAHEISVYKTLPAQPDSNGLAALKNGVDWITFTSPSTVQNFAEIVRKYKMDPLHLNGDPRIACIGPITEHAAQEEGFKIDLVAEKYTTEGLVEALSNA